jgi:hypothetical protein
LIRFLRTRTRIWNLMSWTKCVLLIILWWHFFVNTLFFQYSLLNSIYCWELASFLFFLHWKIIICKVLRFFLWLLKGVAKIVFIWNWFIICLNKSIFLQIRTNVCYRDTHANFRNYMSNFFILLNFYFLTLFYYSQLSFTI